jgi:hypothetical protein
MKTLNEFVHIVEEEKTDYTKFDTLVRAGLANKAQIQRIHAVLEKMKEDKPVFTQAEREIVQSLFNKMVNTIVNNKQIYQQARRVVKEAGEAVVDSSDYKVTPSGRKVRAHRINLATIKEEDEVIEEALDKDPPYTIILKREAIRLFPNGTKIALYYNKKLDRYFSIPYGEGVNAPIQAEETIQEAVIDQLHKIVSSKSAQRVKFADGSTRKVDHFTASAITQVHNALNDDNKKKFADMVHKSPAHLMKASDFAFKHSKK